MIAVELLMLVLTAYVLIILALRWRTRVSRRPIHSSPPIDPAPTSEDVEQNNRMMESARLAAIACALNGRPEFNPYPRLTRQHVLWEAQYQITTMELDECVQLHD